jgi:hypothetical protein
LAKLAEAMAAILKKIRGGVRPTAKSGLKKRLADIEEDERNYG